MTPLRREAWCQQVPRDQNALANWLAQGRPLWESSEAMGHALKEAAYKASHEDLQWAEWLGRGLILLGHQAEEEGLIALGEIALGDALRQQTRLQEGCALLDQAAARFERLGDEVGWARTRIGWIGALCHLPDYPHPDPIVARAAEIFKRHEKWPWLAYLCANFAHHQHLIGRLTEGLAWAHRAQQAASQIPDEEERVLALVVTLMTTIGLSCDLGHYTEAQSAIDHALELVQPRPHLEKRLIETRLRAAHFFIDTGRYAQALFQVQAIQQHPLHPIARIISGLAQALAYLHLNRLEQSEAIFQQVLEQVAGKPDYHTPEIETRVQMTRLYLARHQWEEAHAILRPALDALEAAPEDRLAWLSEAYRHWALILHHLGQHEALPPVMSRAIQLAEQVGEPPTLAAAQLVVAQVAADDQVARQALERADALCDNIPWLRWRVHQLAARRASSAPQRRAALEQATQALDRVQSALTASYHADFLADALTVYDELIAVYLAEGAIEQAWQSVERAKSRALLNTMMVVQEAPHAADSPHLAALKRLQLRHYELVRARWEGRATPAEVEAVEEELAHLQAAVEVERWGDREPLTVPPPFAPTAPPDSDLLAFYLVGEEVHGFLHDGERAHHVRLPTTPQALHNLMQGLFVHLRGAPGMDERWIGPMLMQLDGLLAELDRCLLAPLRPLARHTKWVLVPHGMLHQLPFHLLRHEDRYLLERCEVRVVPTARLAQRAAPRVQAGTLRHVVVSHDWGGKLPRVHGEGEMVAALLGGTLLAKDAATKAALLPHLSGGGVLHIAAHGEHRADRPELSHIQLEDGQLSLVDLFHHPIPYDLVTLSACDTGRAVIRAGDDPVGLWRGFLAAGANSLLVSLWQLEDECAQHLMRDFYEKLVTGVPKNEALRLVQCQWLAQAEGRHRHPFYWGALQLVGDDGPLGTSYKRGNQ